MRLSILFITLAGSLLLFAGQAGAQTTEQKWYMAKKSLLGAVYNGTVDEVRQLLDGGASLNVKEGLHTPISTAIEVGKPDILELLLARGAEPLGLSDAIRCSWKPKSYFCHGDAEDYRKIIDVFIKGGVEITLGNLYTASRWHSAPVLKEYVKRGGTLDIVFKIKHETLLWPIIRNTQLPPNKEVMQILLDGGADPNVQTEEGGDSFFHALAYGQRLYLEMMEPYRRK